MAMPMGEFKKLTKLMMMTNSENDQEALTAIRGANKILAKHNYDWNATFGRLVKVEGEMPVEIEEAPDEKREASILRSRVNNAFATIEESDPRGDFADFIASLKDQWDKRGRLTENQLSALFRSADKARDRR